MTLIVVKSSRDTILAMADTKLTPENDARWRVSDQSLKFVALGELWIVGYAGNAHWAEITLSELLSRSDFRFSTVQRSLLEANVHSIKSGSDVDFLLINIQTRSVSKVAQGRYSKQTGNTSWIGDHRAFAKFQELFHLGPQDTHPLFSHLPAEPGGFDVEMSIGDEKLQEMHRRMKKAFRAIIADTGSPAVGGFPITLVLRDNYARYWAGVMQVAAQPYPKIAPSRGWDTLRGEAGTGDFNYEIVATLDARDNIVVLLFPLSGRAVVFSLNGRGIPYAVPMDVDTATAEETLKTRFDKDFWRVRIHNAGSNRYEINADVP